MKLLGVIAAVFVLVASAKANIRFINGHVRGEFLDHSDGKVTLKATVIGGSPPPNKFTWTLPDGTKINAGQTHGSFQAIQRDLTHHELLCNDGYTSFEQRFTFKAENRWWATFNFRLSARTVARPTPTENDNRIAKLTGETDYNSDNSVTLEATVTGGSPAPNSFVWTLSNGARLSPGHSSGSIRAFHPRVNADGSSTYRLHLGDGRKSTSQSIQFRCEHIGNGGWWNVIGFTVQAITQVNVAGAVKGNSNTDFHGVITIEAEVVGGNPKANSFIWTVQHADGTNRQYPAGSGPAGAVFTNTRGNLATTLTITEKARFTRRFKLDVASYTSSGFRSWWANRSWSAWATA